MKLVELNEDDNVVFVIKVDRQFSVWGIEAFLNAAKKIFPPKCKFLFLPPKMELDTVINCNHGDSKDEEFLEHLEKRNRSAIFDYAMEVSEDLKYGKHTD